MSDDSTEKAAIPAAAAAAAPASVSPGPTDNDTNTSMGTQPLSSDTLKAGDPISDQLIQRLGKLEKYEHKLAEVARVYRNLNTARKAVENVLKLHTPVQSIADTEELEAHLSNLNLKTQYAGEQIGALTELDKNNRAKILELESQLNGLKSVEMEKVQLAKELEKVGKERKVVEGQLERSNQKLKLDVGNLETQLKTLRGKLEDAEKQSREQERTMESIDGLAEKLLSLVSEHGDVETDGVLRKLCASLVDRLGAPEGLVTVGELETAVVNAGESHLQEMAQLKDIMRKEMDASEQRSKDLVKEKDELVGQVHLHKAEADKFKQEIEVLKTGSERITSQPAAPSGADELTLQRVNEIIVAAVSHRLVPSAAVAAAEAQSPSPKPAQQQQQQQGGGKSKNKKKRKGTVSSGTPSKACSPAAPVPAKIDDGQQAEVAASKTEIERLVSLVEAISVSTEKASAATEQPSKEAEELAAELRSTIDGLQTQLKEQQQKAEDSQTAAKEQVAKLEQRISELEKDLSDAVDARDALQKELLEKSGQMKDVVEQLETVKAMAGKVPELDKQVQDAQGTVQRLESELEEGRKKLAQAESELIAVQSTCATLKQNIGDAEKERVQLASSLAKAQGVSIRMESQHKELQAQLGSEKKRAEKTQSALDALDAEHTRTLNTLETQAKATSEAERQLAEVRSTVSGLEEHVRAVDADLANSREQFAEKSRLLAQTTAQLQEMQYAVEKERRTARISADEAAKELAGVREQLAEVRRLAKEQRAGDQKEIEKLRDQLGDLDQFASQASQVERLQAQQTEKEAELETLRTSLRSTEEMQTALQVEVDRLRDVERDFKTAKEQLDRVTEERKLSEQRWKRLHRDLKEEVRRLHRERQAVQNVPNSASGGGPLSPLPSTSPTRQSGGQQQQQHVSSTAVESSGVPSVSSASSRSNSMTLASVSSLLRAATGNAAASTANGGIAGRRGSAQPQSSSPSLFGSRPGRFPHQQQLQETVSSNVSENTVAIGASHSDTFAGNHHKSLQMADGSNSNAGFSRVHTRTSSNAGSSSDSVLGQEDFRPDNVNVEYLRNVLFRFFNDKERRPQLVPVLSMLLHCKIDDIKQIQLMLQ
ncbi:hypothetical protein FB645_002294 [Coemansia sp. IMI 203386]|nr:hypothetical protein FB645_002294 [Coemansia sp. IMI 203386]